MNTISLVCLLKMDNTPDNKTLLPYRDNRVDNWSGIDEFVCVAELGHFSGAARRLGVSSSHISRQIARLEDRLQTRLFYRSTRRVTLTEAVQAVTDLSSEPKGLLRMTCSVAYGEEFIMPLVNEFMEQYPQLRIEMALTNQTLDLLHGQFDLAIRLGRLQDSRLVATRLAPR